MEFWVDIAQACVLFDVLIPFRGLQEEKENEEDGDGRRKEWEEMLCYGNAISEQKLTQKNPAEDTNTLEKSKTSWKCHKKWRHKIEMKSEDTHDSPNQK